MQNYLSKSKVVPIVGLFILIFAISIFIFRPSKKNTATALDSFAQCLTEKGFVMYGTYWCSHCRNEKEAFGDSFQYAAYVECTEEPGRCAGANVQKTPTWVAPGGVFLEGEQGIGRLSEVSGCALDKIDITN